MSLYEDRIRQPRRGMIGRVTRWVHSYWDEEDVHLYWEVGDDGWVTRSVELQGPELRPQVAAELTETLAARDSGNMRAYELQFGVLVDQAILEWDFPHEAIAENAFEELWLGARQALA